MKHSNLNHNDRLGFYRVGFKKFYTKTLALMEKKKTGYSIDWVFNDDVYGSFDWSIPIETPLRELYRIRAQQIRDRYDYICLSYSGGADSSNILHAFIDNNIFIDEISMFLCEPDRKNLNTTDLTNRNTFAEIEFEAKDHIQRFRNQINPNTKITVYDISKPAIETFKKDNWFETIPTDCLLGLSSVSRGIAICDEVMKIANRFNGTKRIAHVLGTEKPLIFYDGNDYFCFFSDQSAYHAQIIDKLPNKGVLDICFTEFFYWTPDLPEIVIKQAQEIKKHAEMDNNLRYMLRNIKDIHITNYRKLFHPIIYPKHTSPKFQVSKLDNSNKGSIYLKKEKDLWFWNECSTEIKGNFFEISNFLKKNIDATDCNNYDFKNGLSAINIGWYKL
jgi:hypothetical protein